MVTARVLKRRRIATVPFRQGTVFLTLRYGRAYVKVRLSSFEVRGFLRQGTGVGTAGGFPSLFWELLNSYGG